MNTIVFQQTCKDLLNDFDEQLYLLGSFSKQLAVFDKKAQKVQKHIPLSTYQYIKEQMLLLQQKINDLHKEIKELQSEIKREHKDFREYSRKKGEYHNQIRAYYSFLGSLITALDWQSPSFLHSTFSMAGKDTGTIIATYNDYKRDLHRDGFIYESQFVKEYVKGPPFVTKAFLTNSGMSAFTTVINFLQMQHLTQKPIIIGKAVYFENKEIVKKIFGDNVIEVDESNTEECIQAIDKYQPAVLIFDTLGNNATVTLPDWKALFEGINDVIKRHVFLILDNTCLGPTFHPLSHLFSKQKKISPIVCESLLKYHQFGMDRVGGGIIYSFVKTRLLFLAREHLGTNIGDAAVYSLPIPNKNMLRKRLIRLERNTTMLATYLSKKRNKKIIERVVYPLFVKDPEMSSPVSFYGSFFVLRFTPAYRSTRTQQRFLKLLVEEAKKRYIPITAGTSFGFNTTRVYLTALSDIYGEPFFRIAVGMETREEVEELKKIFAKVFAIL